MSRIFFRIGTALALFLALLLPAAAQQNTGLLREVYLGIGGNTLADLTNAPAFPATPSQVELLTDFIETPTGFGNNYGQRLRGFVIPPTSGRYVFWIASDDQSSLLLGRDDDPASRREIAHVSSATSPREWDREPGQRSQPIQLQAGRPYYIEILMKEGGGGDHLSLRWQLPSGQIEEPMPASRCVPFGTAFIPPTITGQPGNRTVDEGALAVFTVRVKNTDTLGYQWLRNGLAISGANSASFTNPAVVLADHLARYRCILTNALGTAVSEEAVLTVVPDLTAPEVQAVANLGTTNILVVFSEPVLNAVRTSNYSIDTGARILSAAYGPDLRRVVLTTTPLTDRTTYTLVINQVFDTSAAANRLAPNTTRVFTTVDLVPTSVGEPVLAGTASAVPGGVALEARGIDIGGTNDVFLFAYQSRTGDFDLETRVESFTLTDPWAKAGIVAREGLNGNSRFAGSFTTPSLSGSAFIHRGTTGAVAEVTGSFPANYPHTWLRLRREGDLFTGFASLDGSTWSILGQATLRSTNTFFVGLAATSRNTNTTARAVFKDFLPVVRKAPIGPVQEREPMGSSTRRTGLVFSEIMFSPVPRADGVSLEFIELLNTEPVPKDLGGFRLAGDVSYTFPKGWTLPSGAYAVVAASAEAASLLASTGANVAPGSFTGRLNDAGGRVQLLHRIGGVLLDAAFGTTPPWPAQAAGTGHSLVLARPSHGEGSPRAWDASDVIGGSPGTADPLTPEPLRAIRINEILAHTDEPVLDFVELYNHGNADVTLGGCVLTDAAGADRYVFAPGVVIPARSFLALNQSQLGFSLSSAGETLYLKNAARTRVVEAVRFGPQANGVAFGRFPDGAPGLRPLAQPTPDAPNSPFLIGDLVINEIMYNPISGEEDEFVELHNRSTREIPLHGWRFVDGIEFEFPAGITLPPGGYLAVARNLTRLLANHPGLGTTNAVGNFSGALDNGGERIALARPEAIVSTNSAGTVVTNTVYVVMDEVTYGTGGRWGKWSDGGGSSLEMLDPHGNNQDPANWGDSDESRKARWTEVEATGVLDQGSTAFAIDEIQLLLQGAGECVIDDVEVFGPGGNLVPNPTFEGGPQGWEARGTHSKSTLQANDAFRGSRSFRIVANGRGDTGPNQVRAPLSSPLAPGQTARIRFNARWLRGEPEILARLHGNHLEAWKRLEVPANLGTPGARNSRSVLNGGPTITDVQHSPTLPAPHEPVVVRARVFDPDGIAAVTLRFRVDPSVSILATNMVDNGTRGDLVAGDGVYAATIPGVAAQHIIAFHVEATDNFFLRANSRFPSSAPEQECLVLAGDTQPPGNLGTYRVWFTQKTREEWEDRGAGSNEPLDATFVYGNSRVVYNMQTYYSGSPFHWTGYNGPLGGNCNYVMVFPEDDLFLGSSDFVLNSPANLGNDNTGQREQTFFNMAEAMDRPHNHRRYVHVFVNGLRRGNPTSDFIFEDCQQPNREMIEQWHPLAPDGELYKIEDWFEFDANGFSFSNVDASLRLYLDSNGDKKLARYRWAWRKRAVTGSASDYASLLQLVDAINTQGTDEYTRAVESVIDVRDWLKTTALRHTVGDWDSYGYGRGKNMYAYKPAGGRWTLFDWDIAFAFGQGDGPTTDLFSTIEPPMRRFMEHPPFRRQYLQILKEIADGPLSDPALDAQMEARFKALRGNGVDVASPVSIRSYMASRRNYIRQVLSTNDAPFSITSPDATGFTTNRNLVVLEGTAPIEAIQIAINGVEQPLTWLSTTRWRTRVALGDGLNRFVVSGRDATGTPLADFTSTLEIRYTGGTANPADHVVINEVLYNPAEPGSAFVELHNTSATHTFDLSTYRLAGIDFNFPGGSLIPPQGFLVVARDPAALLQRFGSNLPVVGPFLGTLSTGGETLSLIRPGTAPVTLDSVTYSSESPWPATQQPDTSIQVIDPFQDNSRAGNWAATGTPEGAAPQWEFMSVTGPSPGNTLEIYLTSPGHLFLDDITLVTGNIPGLGANLLRNPGFESGLAGSWNIGTRHATSGSSTAAAFAGSASLRVETSESGGNTGAITQAFTPTGSGNVTLGFWYLAGSGGGELVVRAGPLIEARVPLASTTSERATPGRPNTVLASLPPFPALFLNELQTENTLGPVDASGTREPWVELHNAGSTPLPLAGYELGTGTASGDSWRFPDTAVIQPGAFLLIWLDGETHQGSANELHASFRPAINGGNLHLARVTQGQRIVLDSFTHPRIPAGGSFGRNPDGTGQARVLATATPRASNSSEEGPVLVRINEWLASNNGILADPADGDFDDWIELVNLGSRPVDLTGYSLSDSSTNLTKWSFPAGSTIAPGGFLLVWADEEGRQASTNSPYHANFKLSASGEDLFLTGPSGAVIDSVQFGPQKTDVSQGRLPDGDASNIVPFTTPTPARSNQGTAGGFQVAGVLTTTGELQLEWTSEPGTRYQVEATQTLTPALWEPVGAPITATGPRTRLTERLELATPHRFYRIRKP